MLQMFPIYFIYKTTIIELKKKSCGQLLSDFDIKKKKLIKAEKNVVYKII